MTSSLVRDVMTTQVVTVQPSTPFKEIAARLAQHRISAVPVVDADRRVLGIITEADLLLKQEHPDPKTDVSLIWTRRRRRERAKAAAAVAGKLMTAPAVTVAPTVTVTEAARRMHAAGVKRLPVVDDAGRLVGIVSRADLLKVFTRPDEAIRSQIISEVIVGDLMMDPAGSSSRSTTGWSSCRARSNAAALSPTWSAPFITWRAWSGSRTGSASTWTTTTRRSPTPGCGPERAGNEVHGDSVAGPVTAPKLTRLKTQPGRRHPRNWPASQVAVSTDGVSLTVERTGNHTCGMEKFSLEARARALMNSAATAPAGRAAETVYGGHEHVLRQTLIALTAGSVLSEHENPGEATVQVLGGRVRLVADTAEWEGRDGDLLIVPKARHTLHAVEHSAVLLTVAKLP